MTPPDSDVLRERDPSLAIALAALVQVAGEGGAAGLSELVLVYRELYLHAARAAAAAPLGELSADELRENLLRSVLPRLVDGGFVVAVPEGPEAAVLAAPAWWDATRLTIRGNVGAPCHDERHVGRCRLLSSR